MGNTHSTEGNNLVASYQQQKEKQAQEQGQVSVRLFCLREMRKY